jgi:hypothetical protein
MIKIPTAFPFPSSLLSALWRMDPCLDLEIPVTQHFGDLQHFLEAQISFFLAVHGLLVIS